MSTKQATIVSLSHSGWNRDIQHVLLMIARGESFGIWCGRHRDAPATWVAGKVALRLKVGKRRRLIKGHLTFEYEGYDEDGETYSWLFTPSQPRTFPLQQRMTATGNPEYWFGLSNPDIRDERYFRSCLINTSLLTGEHTSQR